MKEDTVYLRHIRECIRRIEEDVAGGREEFMGSHTIQDAVLRNLQTMAEATQRLSDAAKKDLDTDRPTVYICDACPSLARLLAVRVVGWAGGPEAGLAGA